ncbi:MAG: hypothetical protein AAF581_10250 [Planctomycetota bacterium]
MADLKPDDVLRSFGSEPGVTISNTGDACVLVLVRDSITITITAVPSVVEWHVEVADAAAERDPIHDWCDYVGYDATPRDDLTRDMATDLRDFLDCLIARPLRFAVRNKPILEWQTAGEWRQAVPLAPADN